jgi:two-component system sensor histidine kinase HydH
MDRIESTVSKLLWMSRKAEHTPVDLGMKSAVENVHSFLKYKIRKGGIVFRNDVPDDLHFTIDVHDIQQLLLNLFINAIHAMESGGILTVKGSREEAAVIVEVVDTGCGIAPENVGRIFDPFFTTKPTGEGTGLGLWLTYEIVRNYDGEITVRSKEGEGSRFIMRFPERLPA